MEDATQIPEELKESTRQAIHLMFKMIGEHKKLEDRYNKHPWVRFKMFIWDVIMRPWRHAFPGNPRDLL